ncbi:MAG: flavin reductase family protein [Verrucomicrobiota bacterium]
MLIDFASLEPKHAYARMVSLIIPRPIAWVSTISADGRTNLAPFSFFNGVTSNPPTLMFVPVNDRHGNKKDTVRNIEAVPEFVVHIVNGALAEKMNACAALLPYGESEFDAFDIASTPSDRVRAPRVADAPVAFECRLHSRLDVGEGPLAGNIIVGQILCAHVRDDVLDDAGLVDPLKLDPVARLGGESYSRLGELFAIKRPDRR